MKRLGLLFLWAGCAGDNGITTNGTGMTGDPCMTNTECASGYCLPDPFPGGYCSADCSTNACPGDTVCKVVGGLAGCLKPCAKDTDCRTLYSCFQGVCRPPCTGDGECGTGFGCTNGSCQPLPGNAIGEPCNRDSDCSSRLCDPNMGTCEQACTIDADCGAGATCWVNPIDKNADGSTDALLPICVKKRGGVGPGQSCKHDSDCDAGQCELGVCVTLCQTGGNCVADQACVDMIAQVDIGAPQMKGCLMRAGTLTWNLGPLGSGPVGLPSSAVGFNIFVEASADNPAYFAGIADLEDPTGRSLYSPPQTQADFLGLPIRYMPSEGASMVLVSNAPNRVSLIPGLYSFSTFAQNQMGQTINFSTRVRIKLASAAPTGGTIPLHVFVTNLAGGCEVFDAASAPQNFRIQQWEAKVKSLFAQIGLTVGPITYANTAAPNTFTDSGTIPNPQLDNELKTATLGDTPDALEVVIVKRIDTGNQNFEVLGVAGGIPGSTGIPGTIHSGAAVSLSSLCNMGPDSFAVTAAHELGHTLGLYHSQEQDGSTDPLADTKANPTGNLMYWLEGNNNNLVLTPQQGQVILANPAVQ